jgi:hypothetical protein
MELFAQPEIVIPVVPSVDQVRNKLSALIERLQAEDAMPLSQRELLYWQTVAPQMARWLPENERHDMVSQFEAEMARLRAA